MAAKLTRFLLATILLTISLILLSSTFGCTKVKTKTELEAKNQLSKVPKEDTSKVLPSRTITENTEIEKLSKSQQSDIWEFTPSKVKRASSITGDLGWSYRTEVNPKADDPDDAGAVSRAGKGREYILVFFKAKNISDMKQELMLTYDPQPEIISSDGVVYTYDGFNEFRLPEKDQFTETSEIDIGKTREGWLLFNLPIGKHDLKFRIEGLVWGLD